MDEERTMIIEVLKARIACESYVVDTRAVAEAIVERVLLRDVERARELTTRPPRGGAPSTVGCDWVSGGGRGALPWRSA
jgi:hypothetical protein